MALLLKYKIPHIFKQSNILSLLICFYMFLNFMKMVSNNSSYYYFSCILIFIVVLFKIFINNQTFYEKNFLALFSLFIFSWIFMIINDRISFDPVLIVTNGLLVHLILKNKLNYRIHYVFFLCLCLFFLWNISHGVYPGQLFLGGSRNTVTIVLFMNIALLHFIEYINENHISLLPVVPFVCISIAVMGRAGIICSLIYIFYILYHITQKRISLRILIIMLLLFSSIICYDKIELIFTTYFNTIINKGINYTNDPRMNMLTRYLENIDPFTFFIGYDIGTDAFFKTYNGNPHNSFINLHIRIGILSLPFILLIIFKLLKLIRTNFFFVVLLSLILFRAWIDTMFFFNVYDFIIYSILIYKSRSRIIYENNQSR